jgi:hypothetical protein
VVIDSAAVRGEKGQRQTAASMQQSVRGANSKGSLKIRLPAV